MIGTKLGPYEITAKLGEGGMGEVYRAIDTKLEREVAIKVLPPAFSEDPERLARFEREAKLLAQLHHPNIASIFGLEESGGVKALVMELVPGPTLAERLEAGPLSLTDGLAFAAQIAQALEEAHEKGIVHRDLKPQNIKASSEGKVKVLDFGLAKAMDSTAGAASAADLARSPTMMNSPTLTAAHGTQLGVILGTAAYMAPEQAKGVAVDKRADIWAFGVVLYEMLAGGSLFAGDSVAETLAGVLKSQIDFSRLPAETPAAVRQLVHRCLERNPRNRLHDIADARIVLEEVIQGGGASAPAPGLAPAPAVAARSSRRELAAWAAALIATVTAVSLLAGGRSGAPRRGAERPQVTRFSVVPEAQGRLRGFPALSPDGRTMIYSLRPDAGAVTLWAHSFETGKSQAIPGTEGGQHPFWSPDGQQLAFFAGGQLKRLDLATGLAQTLAQAADSRGGTWTADGEILFSDNSSSALTQVSAATGKSGAATFLKPERGEQSHRFPWALPGGGFLYVCVGNGEVRGVYWQGPGDTPAKKILSDMSRAIYDGRGSLLWVREGSLVAQPFDPATGEFSGRMLPIAEKIGADEQAAADAWFAVSGEGTIAFRTGSREHTELRWFDRDGSALAVAASAGKYTEPALSPDGRQIAVSVEASNKEQNLWIFDASGLDRGRRLTFDPAGADTAIWSPDGRWIAFSSVRAKGWELFRKSSDGSGEEEKLFESGVGSWVDSWSPDGKRLLFERFQPERGADLWLLSLAGERTATPFLETPANEGHGAFSPDGRLVAYVSDEGGLAQVYVRTAETGGLPGSHWQVSRHGADWPAWSADGSELFFAGLDRTLYSLPIQSRAPFTFGTPTPLFRLNTPDPKITSNRTYFAAAPDGRRFLVNQLVGEAANDRIDVLLGWTRPAETP